MRTILLVDDEMHILRAAEFKLKRSGFNVLTASDGEAGIEQARRERPAVILLDIMMPGLDGWETLERLKVDEVTRDIPVVVFSAREAARGPASPVASRSRGADEFVSKPFEPGQLVSLIRQHVDAAVVTKKTA